MQRHAPVSFLLENGNSNFRTMYLQDGSVDQVWTSLDFFIFYYNFFWSEIFCDDRTRWASDLYRIGFQRIQFASVPLIYFYYSFRHFTLFWCHNLRSSCLLIFRNLGFPTNLKLLFSLRMVNFITKKFFKISCHSWSQQSTLPNVASSNFSTLKTLLIKIKQIHKKTTAKCSVHFHKANNGNHHSNEAQVLEQPNRNLCTM